MNKMLHLAYDENGNDKLFLGVFKTREAALSAIEEYVEEMRGNFPEFDDGFCYVEEVKSYDV